MKRRQSVSSVLRPLCEARSQVYMDKVLQVVDILDWALYQVGMAEVWLTSFSISEEFLRRLFFLRQRRDVSKIHLLLDFKATHKTLTLLPFMRNAVDNVYLSDNHSKIMLIRGGSSNVSLVSSQNLTRGNRFESGFISSDDAIFDTLLAHVQNLIINNSIKVDELFR